MLIALFCCLLIYPSAMLGTTPSAWIRGWGVGSNPVISLLALIRYSKGDGMLIAFIGALAGVYLFYRGFRLLQRKRLILNTPASKIRSASMGLVEINGLAVGPYTLMAPVTGVPCYYFRTMAWQWQQRGKNCEWVKVADESLHVPFFLDDNTGRVLVDPQGAEMDIHRDFHDEFSTALFSSSLEIPSGISNFLARNGVSTDRKIRVDEYCIKPKNALFILGTLAQNPGLTASATPVRSITAEQHTVSFRIPGSSASLALTAGVPGPEAISFETFAGETRHAQFISYTERKSRAPAYDSVQSQKVTAALLKAGISNPAAWAAAGVSSAAVTISPPTRIDAGTGSADQFELHPPVVLMKGAHDTSFLVSWHSQRDVVRSLSWKSALMIWGGPALTLMCAYFVAAYFDWL